MSNADISTDWPLGGAGYLAETAPLLTYRHAFTLAARDERGRPWARRAWRAWMRLTDPDVWRWFVGAVGLDGNLGFLDLVEDWAACGLYPGVERVQRADIAYGDVIDPDIRPMGKTARRRRTQAGVYLADVDDVPIVGEPAISLPIMGPRAIADWQGDGALEPAEILYFTKGGGVLTVYGKSRAFIGRDPVAALERGRVWRLYATPSAWLADALALKDGFNPLAPDDAPGGGAITDMDAFVRHYGERLRVSVGNDFELGRAYEKRRRALLRPARPKLPDVLMNVTREKR